MKQKVVVKIFLPKKNAPVLANQTEYLYGEINSEYTCERACRQVLIFVTKRRTDKTNDESTRTPLIGEIKTGHKISFQTDLRNDYVWLDCDSDAPDTVRLKHICLPTSAPDPECQFKVQIILYEPKTFLKLARDDGELHQNTAVLDPIAYLIKLLRHNELPNKPSQTWSRRLQHFLWLFLMTVNRVYVPKLLRINESAFLRHFSIWINSIKLFTFKRLVDGWGCRCNCPINISFCSQLQRESVDHCIRRHIRNDSNVDFTTTLRSRRVPYEIH